MVPFLRYLSPDCFDDAIQGGQMVDQHVHAGEQSDGEHGAGAREKADRARATAKEETRRAAGQVERVTRYLHDEDAPAMPTDLEDMARRNPGTFLGRRSPRASPRAGSCARPVPSTDVAGNAHNATRRATSRAKKSREHMEERLTD